MQVNHWKTGVCATIKGNVMFYTQTQLSHAALCMDQENWYDHKNVVFHRVGEFEWETPTLQPIFHTVPFWVKSMPIIIVKSIVVKDIAMLNWKCSAPMSMGLCWCIIQKCSFNIYDVQLQCIQFRKHSAEKEQNNVFSRHVFICNAVLCSYMRPIVNILKINNICVKIARKWENKANKSELYSDVESCK